MPTVPNFRVVRTERVELHELDLGPVKVADFEVPAEATRHPAVLTLMVGPPFGMPSNSDFRFALVLNGRDLMSDVVISPPGFSTVLHHHPRTDAIAPMTTVSVVIPTADPPWLKAGSNSLELRETDEPQVHVGDAAGVGVSDVVLWFREAA